VFLAEPSLIKDGEKMSECQIMPVSSLRLHFIVFSSNASVELIREQSLKLYNTGLSSQSSEELIPALRLPSDILQDRHRNPHGQDTEQSESGNRTDDFCGTEGNSRR
jgi:hypothetical protein